LAVLLRACPNASVRNQNELNRRRDVACEPCEQTVSSSLFTGDGSTLYSPKSVNPSAAVNRESPRDSAFLDGVGIRKRAILNVDLAGRDERLGAAVNKKRHKTRDLNEKSRDSRLGSLCLPDWLSFEPILKGSPSATLFVTILSFKIRHKCPKCKDLREFETCSVSLERSKPVRYFFSKSDSL
jgi:hypothetical protein